MVTKEELDEEYAQRCKCDNLVFRAIDHVVATGTPEAKAVVLNAAREMIKSRMSLDREWAVTGALAEGVIWRYDQMTRELSDLKFLVDQAVKQMPYSGLAPGWEPKSSPEDSSISPGLRKILRR